MALLRASHGMHHGLPVAIVHGRQALLEITYLEKLSLAGGWLYEKPRHPWH